MTNRSYRSWPRGFTDAELAERVGCSRSMIARIRQRAATPSLPLALAISRETGTPVEELVASRPVRQPDQGDGVHQ